MDDSDGIEEATSQAVSMVGIAAARAFDQLARERERNARAAADAARRDAELAASRAASERAAAAAYFAVVSRDEFLDNATPEELQQAHDAAGAWREIDERAAQVEQATAARLEQQQGQTGQQTSVTETVVVGGVLEGERVAQEERDEAHEAGTLEDGREDESVTGEWDSPGRREELAATLSEKVDNERAVQARITADVSQGRPAQDAVRQPAAASAARGRSAVEQALQRQAGIER